MASDPSFVANRLSFSVNIMSFGADPTGVEDSGPAFAAAIEVCRERNYSTLRIPAGNYKIMVPEGGVGWLLEEIHGLCIVGDGALPTASHEGNSVGTTIRFELPEPPELAKPSEESSPSIGLAIKACTGIRIQNLTLQGAANTGADRLLIGVRIESISGVGSYVIQFQNVHFMWFAVCVQTANTNNNSEIAFYDCNFYRSHVGFQCLHSQALVNRFFACIGGGGGSSEHDGMDVMFDLTAGGNITVVGFGGQSIKTFVKVGAGGPNIGWNEFFNVRLEAQGEWGEFNRIRIYEAVQHSSFGGGQRTAFYGLVITPPSGEVFEPDNGVPRFLLLRGHEVQLWNGTRNAWTLLATPTSKLVAFPVPMNPDHAGGTFRCFATDVSDNARVDRDAVPPHAVYSFHDCQDQIIPYPDRLHPPLYGPNYLMSVESHCWALGDALNGVNAVADGGGAVESVAPSDVHQAGVIACKTAANGAAALISHHQALRPGGGTWWFQASARVTAIPSGDAPEFAVRLGFGDSQFGEPDNGVYFRYRNEHNGDRWEGVIVWNGTMDVVDTGVPKDEDWHTLEIELRAPGDVARFYIDGEYVGTAGESPSEADPTGLLPLQFVRTDGTGTKSAEIDYFKYEVRPSGPAPMFPE